MAVFVQQAVCRARPAQQLWHAACIRDLMTDEEFDAYVTASAAALGLTIDDAWRAEVIANLRVLFANGTLVSNFPLGEHAEAAAVFQP